MRTYANYFLVSDWSLAVQMGEEFNLKDFNKWYLLWRPNNYSHSYYSMKKKINSFIKFMFWNFLSSCIHLCIYHIHKLFNLSWNLMFSLHWNIRLLPEVLLPVRRILVNYHNDGKHENRTENTPLIILPGKIQSHTDCGCNHFTSEMVLRQWSDTTSPPPLLWGGIHCLRKRQQVERRWSRFWIWNVCWYDNCGTSLHPSCAETWKTPCCSHVRC